jgi:hypothetical protein
VWREAGREVADRLFQLLPEPVEEQAPRGSGGSWGWGWDEADETVQPLSSAEVKEFLALPTNAKGETCDEDGVPLFSDDGDDLASIIEQACARGKRAGASGSGSGSRSGGLGLGLELVGFGEADVPPANTYVSPSVSCSVLTRFQPARRVGPRHDARASRCRPGPPRVGRRRRRLGGD